MKACALVSSYLSDRKQTVKLGSHYSEWSNNTKRVPLGSILGPLLFKVFINDIVHALGRSYLYNYADDNTLSYAHHNQWRSQGGARGAMAPPKLLLNVFFLQLIPGNVEVTRKCKKNSRN